MFFLVNFLKIYTQFHILNGIEKEQENWWYSKLLQQMLKKKQQQHSNHYPACSISLEQHTKKNINSCYNKPLGWFQATNLGNALNDFLVFLHEMPWKWEYSVDSNPIITKVQQNK